jgi:hypothetical protein
MIPTKLEIDQMTSEECHSQLAQLEKDYEIYTAFNGAPPPYVDAVANALLYLEDRIAYVRQLASLDKANETKRLQKECAQS